MMHLPLSASSVLAIGSSDGSLLVASSVVEGTSSGLETGGCISDCVLILNVYNVFCIPHSNFSEGKQNAKLHDHALTYYIITRC